MPEENQTDSDPVRELITRLRVLGGEQMALAFNEALVAADTFRRLNESDDVGIYKYALARSRGSRADFHDQVRALLDAHDATPWSALSPARARRTG